MIDLKPCPFCGYQFPIVEKVSKDGLYYVLCRLCSASGPICQAPEIAAMQWNHADKRREKENER